MPALIAVQPAFGFMCMITLCVQVTVSAPGPSLSVLSVNDSNSLELLEGAADAVLSLIIFKVYVKHLVGDLSWAKILIFGDIGDAGNSPRDYSYVHKYWFHICGWFYHSTIG